MDKREYYEINYSFGEIEVDPRFNTCEKEMKIVYIVQLLYTILTIAITYFLGKGDPKDYTYIMGLPLWWFANIVITIIFAAIVYSLTKWKFVDMDLMDEGKMYNQN